MTSVMVRTIDVLDHGKVELVDFMGSDLAIVQAAQSSFANFSTEYGFREERILRRLMAEKHGVPFEAVTFKFRLEMPIFVARQLVKHRMSSWSEQSARYSKMVVEYYMPKPDNLRVQVGKPMDYTFETADPALAAVFLSRLAKWCKEGQEHQRWASEVGIANEQSRFFLPINAYTTITWTMNARGLLNILRLRNDDHAQAETREYAKAMESFASMVIPDTMAAFHEGGRSVP